MSKENPVLFTIGDGVTPGVHFELRDLFAMAALIGNMSGAVHDAEVEDWARVSYDLADAMLKERDKR